MSSFARSSHAYMLLRPLSESWLYLVMSNNFSQHFLDMLRNLADYSHGTREKCIFETSDAKRHFNPFSFPMRHNRANPFHVVSYCNPKDNHTIDDEPFSLIRLRTRSFTKSRDFAIFVLMIILSSITSSSES